MFLRTFYVVLIGKSDFVFEEAFDLAINLTTVTRERGFLNLIAMHFF